MGQRQRRTTLLRVLGVALALIVFVGAAADAYAQEFLSSLPSVQGLDSSTFRGDALIYDRAGVLLADVGSQGDHRLNVTIDKVAPKLLQATVAIEDKNFFQNAGFDIEGILRAAISNYRSQSVVGGGSTITQQLAKQLFLQQSNGVAAQSIDRKIREVVLAYQLSRSYTKNQILELYLNRSYYGDQEYGIQAAARTFIHKDAKDIDLAQAALLAGLPQAPAQWDPVVHADAAKIRQKQVLDAMVRTGYITPEESDNAVKEALTVYGPVNTFLAPHFVAYVQAEMEKLGFKIGDQQLVVRTTLDYSKQQIGEQVVRSNLAANKHLDPNGLLSSSLVSMDPKTGQILVYVGSPDYNLDGGKFDFVSGVPRNPGSSVKPFTYGAVINARKATMDTPILDGPSPLELPQGPGQDTYKVYNYDKSTHGILPLRMALQNSLNIPAVKVELSIGVPAVVQWWRNLGINPRIAHQGTDGLYFYATDDSVYNYGASLTLGGYPITMLEEVTGLSVYANLGVKHDPEAILGITDLKGKPLYVANPDANKRQAIDPGVAFIMASIMSDDQNRCLIFGCNGPLHLPERHAAAKTGTTDSFKDALTIGFTPDLATVIWVGDILDNSHTMRSGSDGIFVAAPGWHDFMEKALAGAPDKWYDPPSGVVKGPGNSWYLADATSIARLPNDNPTPKPAPPDYGIPGDPGAGIQAVPTPAPTPKPKPAPTLPPVP
jgi:membrane peptidoglycan carboxypeptidase